MGRRVRTSLVLGVLAAALGVATPAWAATTCTFNNGAGGNWNTAANWTCTGDNTIAHVPVAGETAVMSVNATVTVSANTPSPGPDFNFGRGTLSFSNEAAMALDDLTYTGTDTRFTGPGTVTVSGTFTKGNNTEAHIADGVDVVLNGPAVHTVHALVFSGGASGSPRLTINNTYTFGSDIAGTNLGWGRSGDPGTSVNVGVNGVVIKNSAGASDSIDLTAPIDNDGLVQLNSGTARLGSVASNGVGSTGEWRANAGTTFNVGTHGTHHFTLSNGAEMTGAGRLTQDTSATLHLEGGSLVSIAKVVTDYATVDVTGGTGPAVMTSAVWEFALPHEGIVRGSGTLHVTNVTWGGGFLFDTVQMKVTGAFVKQNGQGSTNNDSMLELAGTATWTGTSPLIVAGNSKLKVSGTLTMSGSSLNLVNYNNIGDAIQVVSGGRLQGTGLIRGPVQNVAGTVAPGNGGIGTLSIDTAYEQFPAGKLEIEVGPGGHDVLNVTDDGSHGSYATLAGTLDIVKLAGFAPATGDTFHFLTNLSQPATGTFTTVNGASLSNGGSLAVSYPQTSPHGAKLTATAPPPPGAGTATISGTPEVGQHLTCQSSGFSGATSTAYAWLRNNVVIASGANYTVVLADATQQLSCRATATNSGGNTIATSAPVTVAGPPAAGTATVSGTPATGQALTCTTTGFAGAKSTAFEWLRGSDAIATGATYTVTDDDAGRELRCRATATNPAGTATATSDPVTPPLVAPVVKGVPSIAGTNASGKVLTCDPGVWTGSPVPTFTYQWERDGVAIPGATSQSYTVVDADRGHDLVCVISATSRAGNGEARTEKIRIPAPPSLLIECARLSIALVDVVRQGGRVLVTGVAAPTAAGQAVNIVLVDRRAAGKAVIVGSPVIGADGSFKLVVAAPKKTVKVPAYYAVDAAGKKSATLALDRRLLVDSVTLVAGQVTIVGHATKPLAKKAGEPVKLTVQTSCTGRTVAGTGKLDKKGRFKIVVAAPTGPATEALYRAETKVSLRKGGKATNRTFTLPRPVKLSG